MRKKLRGLWIGLTLVLSVSLFDNCDTFYAESSKVMIQESEYESAVEEIEPFQEIDQDEDMELESSDTEGIKPVKKFKINKKAATLKKGKKLTLKVSNAKGNVQWSSSNKKIAIVNSNGVVTAKKVGNVTIKAYCPSLKKTVKCKIEVYDKISQSQVSKKILNLQNKYKEGKSWGDYDYYFWKAIRTHCYGCAAFVGTVSDKVFGTEAKVTRHYSFGKIKAGDHVRIGNYHSVIVISKQGDKIIVAEGNYNYSVHWGRIITKSELQSEGFYVETRY